MKYFILAIMLGLMLTSCEAKADERERLCDEGVAFSELGLKAINDIQFQCKQGLEAACISLTTPQYDAAVTNLDDLYVTMIKECKSYTYRKRLQGISEKLARL